MQHKFVLNHLASTELLAKQIAGVIVPNFVLSLTGNLGAGKTTLTREVLRNLGVKGSIKSPSFTLVEPYQFAEFVIYHFDLYRFSDPEEWFEAGFDEYFNLPHICFIEWAEKAAGLIPIVDWQISIKFENNQRELTINAVTVTGSVCLNRLITSAGI